MRAIVFTCWDLEFKPPTENPDIKFLVFQHELTPTTQKEHIQGYVRTFKTHKFDAFATILGLKAGDYHFEKARGDDFENEAYCTKYESRVSYTLPFEIGTPRSRSQRTRIKQIIDPLEGKTLYPYQKDIMELLDRPAEDRFIYWYWENKGNVGKTALVKHILLTHPNEVCVVDGSIRDCAFCISEFVNRKDTNLKTVIVDCPRASTWDISYPCLEKIKDGIMFSPKYKSNCCIFNVPHLIVFSNFPPMDVANKLSDGRLRTHEIIDLS